MSWTITPQTKVPVDPYRSQVSLLLHGDGTNGSTTITDSSPTPKTVTAVGNAQISTAQSKFGGSSIAFDGTGDWLNTVANASPQSNNFTWECFIYPTVVLGTDRVVYDCRGTASVASAPDGPNGSGFVVFINTNGRLQVFGNGTGATLGTLYTQSTSALTAATWQHIALVSSGGTVTYYIGGIAAGSFAATTTAALNTRIGARQDSAVAFTGFIDELRLTLGVARYTSNFTPPTAPFPDI